MRRRDLLAILSGAALRPRLALAQSAQAVRRLGIVLPGPSGMNPATAEDPPRRHRQQPPHRLRCRDRLGAADKRTLDVSAREHLTAALMGVFDSQIAGGKRYDLATTGRKRSNATYAEHGQADQASAVEYAMDLTPLISDANLDVPAYVGGLIERFRDDVTLRIRRLGGSP